MGKLIIVSQWCVELDIRKQLLIAVIIFQEFHFLDNLGLEHSLNPVFLVVVLLFLTIILLYLFSGVWNRPHRWR